jgi:hypothetical protein
MEPGSPGFYCTLIPISILLAMVVVTYLREQEKEQKLRELVTPKSSPPTPTKRSLEKPSEPVRRVLTIRLPPNTDWEPAKATRLIELFFALRRPLRLGLHSKNGQISWKIEANRSDVPGVTNAIYSLFPLAQIEETVKESANLGFTVFELHSVTHFLHATNTPDDFKKGISPLASMVSHMTGTVEGGEILYELILSPPSLNYREIAKKLLYHENGDEIYKKEDHKRLSVKAEKNMMEARVVAKFKGSHREAVRHCLGVVAENMKIDGWFYGTVPDENSYPLVLSAEEAAMLWHLPTTDCQASGVSWARTAATPLPTELQLPGNSQTGVFLGSHSYHGQVKTVWLRQPDRITHMNIVGKTRVGKTTFMHNLIHQDIAAGRGVGVIDPHGDLVQTILERSIPPEREQDVVLFDLSDSHYSIPLNILYVPNGVPAHAGVSLTLAVLKKIFAEQWSATRMEDALYAALAVLAQESGATIRDIPRLFLDASFRKRMLSQSKDDVALEYFHDDYEQMSERYQLEVARPIMNRIRAFYRNPVIREIVVQPESLDFRQVMDSGKIFLASLAGEATQGEAATIGALLISKMQMAAMSRARIPAEDRRMFYLYIDEVQNFVTTSLSVMFSEAAKYALSLTVANQFLKQLEGGTLDAVMGNTGTTVMFASGNQDASDLGNYVKPQFDSQTILNLDRFEAIVKMQQSGKTLPAFLIKTPPPVSSPEDAKERVARIRQANYRAEEVHPVLVTEEPEEVDEVKGKKSDMPTLDL